MSADADALVVPLGYALRGRFKLVEVIGEGGISTVYRAVDRIGVWAGDKNPEVAIKVIRPHDKLRREMIELLHREARLLRGMVHRNLVRIYDSDCDGQYHFLIMELLKGRSLSTIVSDQRGKPLSPGLSLRVIQSIGKGLEYMHRLGIIHGDLKPGNIIMTASGEVKIVDFGTSLFVDTAPEQDDRQSTATLLDRVGQVTPTYASLEMLSGQPRAESDDVYSLAVLAYFILTGQHPYLRRNAEQAQKEGLAPARPPVLSAGQWRILAAGLALHRRDRIQTIGEFSRGLGQPNWRQRLFGGD